jgi:hypothetical protein
LLSAGCDEIDEVSVADDVEDSTELDGDAGEAVADADGEDATLDSRDASEELADTGDTDSDDGNADDGMAHCLLIDSTDWINSASLSVLNLDTGELRENLTTYHSDASIQVVEGEVYVVNRAFGDSILKLDPDDNYSAAWEFSLGNTTNPHSLARHGDVGFVSLYDTGKVVEVDLTNPTEESFLTGREIVVPTGEYDGEQAEPGNIFVYEDVLYVVSQGLNSSLECSPNARSRIYAYDANTLEPTNAFADGSESVLELRACNASVYERRGDTLVVRSIGNYQFMTSNTVNDGVVETIELASGTRGDLLFTEQGAGNRDIFILEEDDNRLWGVLAGDDFFGIDLVEIDRSNERWSVKEELYNGYLWALVAYDDKLYVSETGEQLESETIQTQAAPDELVRFDREGDCW